MGTHNLILGVRDKSCLPLILSHPIGGRLMKSGKKFMFAGVMLALLTASALALESSPQRLALVGGTLVDGFGGRPIRNSVVIIEGEWIKAVGQVGSMELPAAPG